MANLLVLHISHEKLLSLVTNLPCFHTAKTGWTSCIALLKNTLSCFSFCSVHWPHWRDQEAAKYPHYSSLTWEHHWGANTQALGQEIALTSCLILSTAAVCFPPQPLLCAKVLWLCLDERRRRTAPDWMLDLWHDIIPVVCLRVPWWVHYLFKFWKGAKDLVSDNWLPSARYALYYYISKIS